MTFVIKVAVNAVAIWVASLIVPGIRVGGSPGEGAGTRILTLLLIGLIFGIVNAVVRPIVRVLAIPLYVLTLGLITFILNALMLELTAWLSRAVGLAFHVDRFWWSAVFAALVVSVVSLALHVVVPDRRRGQARAWQAR